MSSATNKVAIREFMGWVPRTNSFVEPGCHEQTRLSVRMVRRHAGLRTVSTDVHLDQTWSSRISPTASTSRDLTAYGEGGLLSLARAHVK